MEETMAHLALDPHPYGCPVGLAHTPTEMPDVIGKICLKLRGVLRPSVHVVRPSRGRPYPILNLYVDATDPRPRLVLFPGWEDNNASPRRRLDYKRQISLLQRIQEREVDGEELEDVASIPSLLADEPLWLAAAATPPRMVDLIHDCYDNLGDHLRMTVTSLDVGKGTLPILRMYAPSGSSSPLLTLFPGWSNATERAENRIRTAEQHAILGQIHEVSTPEVPIELWNARPF